MARKLTPKQDRFVAEYLKNGNNASAAYRAAYSAGRMTSKTVSEAACRILKNSKVAARIAAAAEKTVKRAEVSTARVLEEAARVALSDLRQIFDEHMNLKPIHEWPDGIASAIASVEVTSIGGEEGLKYVTKVRAWPKAAALDMLMKHMGLYEKDNAQKRPHESLTDDQLRAAITDALGIAESVPAGKRSEDAGSTSKPDQVH